MLCDAKGKLLFRKQGVLWVLELFKAFPQVICNVGIPARLIISFNTTDNSHFISTVCFRGWTGSPYLVSPDTPLPLYEHFGIGMEDIRTFCFRVECERGSVELWSGLGSAICALQFKKKFFYNSFHAFYFWTLCTVGHKKELKEVKYDIHFFLRQYLIVCPSSTLSFLLILPSALRTHLHAPHLHLTARVYSSFKSLCVAELFIFSNSGSPILFWSQTVHNSFTSFDLGPWKDPWAERLWFRINLKKKKRNLKKKKMKTIYF